MTRWLPHTLLGRTVLVLILTVALTEATTQLVFRYFVTEEYSRALVRVGGNNLVAIGQALRYLPVERRAAFVNATSEATGYQIFPVSDNPLPADARPPDSGRLVALEQRLHQRFSEAASVWVESGRDPQRVWVRLPLADGDWWVRIERTRLDRAFPLSAAVLLAASVLLAVMVSWLTVRRLNRPLRAIQANILRLGRGDQAPPALPTDGPTELADLADAVNRMSRALTREDHERALLLAGVSHDLRTPLARLRLGIEMLGAEFPQDCEALVDDIEEIDRIISQFLDFAREAQTMPDGYADLGELAQDCAARARVHGCEVSTELGEELWMPMQRPAMERLINNLIENARRYARTPVVLRVSRQADALQLSVLDRGPGIPEDQRQRLIQPFTRLDASRTGPAGAGLGLAIVDRIARAHHGQLELHARPGGGLEARVTFTPRREPVEEA